MYCPQCGGDNHDSLRYCVTCGFDLDEYRHEWQEGDPAAADNTPGAPQGNAGAVGQGQPSGQTPGQQPGQTSGQPYQQPYQHPGQQPYQAPYQQGSQEPHSSYENQYSQGQSQYGYGGGGPVPRIPTYMGWAIATLILCFWPTGIVAVIYAAQVNNKLAYGDYAGAQESSRKAKMWSWISFGISLAALVILVLFSLVAGLSFSNVY